MRSGAGSLIATRASAEGAPTSRASCAASAKPAAVLPRPDTARRSGLAGERRQPQPRPPAGSGGGGGGGQTPDRGAAAGGAAARPPPRARRRSDGESSPAPTRAAARG